jgi:hypothetical protein
VFYLFQRLPESADQPWERFLRLSFDLNMLPLFEEVRQQFVAIVEYSLPTRGQLETLNKTNQIATYFRNYLHLNDLGELVRSIVSLY